MSTPPPSSPTTFFCERLPDIATESPAATEARVLLELETTSPLPPEKLAYGWVRLPSRDILYYAAPRERTPAHDAFAAPGSVLPRTDDLLLPENVTEADLRAASRDLYADLRPRTELLLLRERAAADRLLSRATPALKIGAVLGLLLAFAGAGLAAEHALREHRLANDAARIKASRERLALLDTLDRFATPARSVFDALAMVNPHRPESVGFTRVVFADNRELTLEGRASDASAVNRMADALRKAGPFGAVDIRKLEASGGRTTFSLRVTVNKWPKIGDTPTAMPSPPANPADGSAS